MNTRAIVIFSDQAEQIVGTLMAKHGIDRSELIFRALERFWWMDREHDAGTRFLAQRGAVITEFSFDWEVTET